MMLSIWSNVRECSFSKPPLVVFTASIAAFALTLVAVSLYIETHKGHLLNPNVKDWNSFYRSMSEMVVCLPNESEPLVANTPSSQDLSSESLLEAVFNKTGVTESNITSTISADLKLMMGEHEIHDLLIHGTIKAEHLGLRRDKSILEVKIKLPSKSAKVKEACLFLNGPSHLLPDSDVAPSSCKMPQNQKTTDVFIANKKLVSGEWCSSSKKGEIFIQSNHNLDIYLSENDTTLMQFHILYTTSLLCVMMVGLLCYAMCGRRASKLPKLAAVSDKVPLQP